MDFFRGGEGMNTLRSSLRSSLVTLNVRWRGQDSPRPCGGLWARVCHGGRWAQGELGAPGWVLVPLTKLGSRTVISLTSRKLKLL